MKKKILVLVLGIALSGLTAISAESIYGNEVQGEKVITESTETINLLSTVEEPETDEIVTDSYIFDKITNTVTFTGKGKLLRDEKLLELNPKKIIIGNGYTSISSHCFSDCSSIESVVLPDSLKTIGRSAFFACGKMKKVNFPNTIENIGTSAFAYTKIEKANLPVSVKKIGGSAFYCCSKLKEASVPCDVIELGSYIFSNCRRLETVKYEAKKIPRATFYRCERLKKIEFGEKLEEIGNSSFYGSGIEKMIMPDTVTELQSSAFAYCKKLMELTISKNIEVIPSYLCSGTNSLDNVIIHKGTKTISKNAFANSGIKNIEIANSVEKIEPYAFYNCKRLEKIDIPSKLAVIRKMTFYNCKSLEKVQFGKMVDTIGESAFENCNIKELYIPKNVKYIGYEAFRNCGARKIVTTNGVERIGNWAFCNNSKLKSVYISDSVDLIEPNAFVECTKLKNITVSKNNKNYSSANGMLLSKYGTTLYCCPAGKEGTVSISSTVRDITEYSFSGCKKIKKYEISSWNKYFSTKDGILFDKRGQVLVRVPEGVEGEIIIPSNVREIGKFAFSNSNISGVKFNDNLRKISLGAFENCNNLKKVKIPKSVVNIEKAAFWHCENLISVRLMDGTKKISPLAFSECYNLKKITIPTSVTSISSTAFSDCYRVTIYCSKISKAMNYAKKKHISYKLI